MPPPDLLKNPFRPSNWYWTVAGDTTRAYSTAVSDYVPANDPALQAWLAANNTLSRIATEAELGESLVTYALPQRPIPPGILQGYDDAIVKELETMKIMRAFSMVMLDEINILRAEHSLAARTTAQLKAAVRAKLGV